MTFRYLLGYIFTCWFLLLTFMASEMAREAGASPAMISAALKFFLGLSLILTLFVTYKLVRLMAREARDFLDWITLYTGLSGIAFLSFRLLRPNHIWETAYLSISLVITLCVLLSIYELQEMKRRGYPDAGMNGD